MASLNLVAPRFSTLGIIEGLRYLKEERNAEAIRQLNLAKVESEIARQRQLSIEADILQQTGLSAAQAEIAKDQGAAYQYTQAGNKYKADATATPILTTAQVAERNANANKYLNQGTAAITTANARATEASSQVTVDNAQASKYYSQGTAAITTANARATEASSQTALDKARANEALMKGNASLIKASLPTGRRMPTSSTAKPLTPSAEATSLQVACQKSGDPNSAACKKYNLRLAPKRTKTKKAIDNSETDSVWGRVTDPAKVRFGTGTPAVTSSYPTSDVVTNSKNMKIPEGTTVIDKNPAYYQFGAD